VTGLDMAFATNSLSMLVSGLGSLTLGSFFQGKGGDRQDTAAAAASCCCLCFCFC